MNRVRPLRSAVASGLLAAATFAACTDPRDRSPTNGSGSSGAVPASPVARQALAALATCATTRTASFVPEAEALGRAVDAWAALPSDATLRAKAKEAWLSAIFRWQTLEPWQFGPGAMSSLPGGRELRDPIYSWPTGGRCLIEQTIVSKGYTSPDFSSGLVSTRTLLALEYLLFDEGATNGCAPEATINTSGAWAALSADERTARKAAYAAVVAKDVVGRGRALADAWAPTSGNFANEFAKAGQGSKAYATEQMALNAAADALFYVYFDVKDMKVARPAGIEKCTAATCLETVESLFAKVARRHILANLEGTRDLLVGCNGGVDPSFDDLLASRGQQAVTADLVSDLDAAIAATKALPSDDLAAAILSEPAKVRVLYDALKRLGDRLRTEFITILDLELPKRIEGDND